jgi:hypothetical protein
MDHDYSKLNSALSTLDECIELVVNQPDIPFTTDQELSLYEDLQLAAKLVRAAVLDAIMTTNYLPIYEPFQNDIVQVEIKRQNYALDRLARHLLYCLEDGKAPSQKYDLSDITACWEDLSISGFIIGGDDEENPYELTDLGRATVGALRARKTT